MTKEEGSGLSKELQIGKAAEHIVTADLILQGYNAFLTDAGLPYDILVDANGDLVRVQENVLQYVKSIVASGELDAEATAKKSLVVQTEGGRDVQVKATMKPLPTRPTVYRFSMRAGKKGRRRIKENSTDIFAFIALDTRRIAYMHKGEISRNGNYILSVEFTSLDEPKRIGLHGRMTGVGRRLIDYASFDRALTRNPVIKYFPMPLFDTVRVL